MRYVCISSVSAEYLQNIRILNFPGSVATYLTYGGYCRIGFVANLIRFPAVQKDENRLRFDKVALSLKVGTFLRHSGRTLFYISIYGSYRLSKKQSGFMAHPVVCTSIPHLSSGWSWKKTAGIRWTCWRQGALHYTTIT